MILFIDVDGTLVDYENQLPQSAVTAIQKARKNGHRVYICTGRSRAEIYGNIWEIGLDGMIGGNGSFVEDQGEVILHQMITEQDSRKIVDWLTDRKLAFYLESNSGLYASPTFETEAEPAILEYSQKKGNTNMKTVRDVFPDMIFDGELYRKDLNKVSYLLTSYQDYLDAKEAFPDLKHGTWGGAGETALFGDIGLSGISKAYAIEVLLNHLGAKKEETIAFGDAEVDLPMFDCCAIAIAMGSGQEKAKKAADYVTTSVEEDGLYQAFSKYCLIDADQMTEAQLHAKLQRGYDDYKAGRTHIAAEAFAKFRECHS